MTLCEMAFSAGCGVSELHFFVNGREVAIQEPDPEMTLIYFLRNELGLTGSKLGCGEGGCGSCTVMLSRLTADKKVEHFSVNACLTPLCAVHGLAVTTIEGIGSTKTALHPCQERIAKAHGTQCGFCTPGFVMTMYSLLRNNSSPTQLEIEAALQGNLCRCTGYRPILDGFKTFACSSSDQCCGADSCTATDGYSTASRLFDASTFAPLDPTQEPIFPAKLMVAGPPQAVVFKGPRVRWYQPTFLQQLAALRAEFPHMTEEGKPRHRIVAGNAGIGVEVKCSNAFYEVLIFPQYVPELSSMRITDRGVVVGAMVTLTQLSKKLREVVQELPAHQTKNFSAVLELLMWFAGQQVRNVVTIGGSVCNSSPSMDLNTLLMAAGTTVHLASVQGQRSLPLNDDFFIGYKEIGILPNEVVVSVEIPFTTENDYVMFYKQARRRTVDSAIVNAAFHVVLDNDTSSPTIKDITLCFGGMSTTAVEASYRTKKSLVGRSWDEAMLQEAIALLLEEFPLSTDSPGGMPEYRRMLVASFFFKFYWMIKSKIPGVTLDSKLRSAAQPYDRPPARGVQGFQRVPGDQSSINPVGRPMMHLSALSHATGEARYTDDLPKIAGELCAGLVLSTHAHANFSVDWSPALCLKGVWGHVTAQDVPGSNRTGMYTDEDVFAEGEVTHIGQIIGMVLAENQMLARRAAKLVRISYSDLPAVITIEDAIKASSYFPEVRHVGRGDFNSAYQDSPITLEGQVRVGGQEHFYLEPHACLAVPKGENGEMEIFAATQNLDDTQKMAASALGIPANRVTARVKRIGGGFGGKESRSCMFSTPTAVAANKCKRPVRLAVDRSEDMIASGGRHPFLGKYKVGFTSEGVVLALELYLYCNAGASMDMSIKVVQKAVTHADNVYNIPNITIVGRACRTNLPSNTSFRGFGAPQGMMIIEQIIGRVARHLNKPAEEIRELNMYHEGDTTPYDMVLSNCTIRRCWAQLKETCSFVARKASVDQFNKENRWKKRGLALIPTKFGIALGVWFGAALLHVYTDGSVLISHGGMEMGQGLHTKMVQVCSCLLKIPPDNVHIVESNSSIVANPISTGASFSTDLYGMAVKDCCEQILERLKPIKAKFPDNDWGFWVKEAYLERINLSAQGFYAPSENTMNWETGKGTPVFYFAYGASCSEVEVDCLTGDHTVLRTDIVNDVGDSINPAIDIGQVEGAFTQGMGLFTMEQLVYLEGSPETQRGQPLTTGPSTYKIPSCNDIPLDFRVSLLGRAPNPKAIFSSKGVGEPPLFLAASVFFAILDAVSAARGDAGHSEELLMDSPATCERIRMACTDKITEQVLASSVEDSKRWTIEV